MAYSELVAVCLVVHSYSVKEDVDSGSALADGPGFVAVGVYTVAVVLVAEVALVGSEQLGHSEVVPDAMLLGVTEPAYCLVQRALDNP